MLYESRKTQVSEYRDLWHRLAGMFENHGPLFIDFSKAPMTNRMSRPSLAILIAVATAVVPARLGAAEPVSPEAAVWLDRAVAELPALRREQEKIKTPRNAVEALVTEDPVASMVFRCRGSESDRSLLLDLAGRTEKAPPPSDSPAGRLQPLTDAANLYSIAGAKGDVHRLLPLMEKAARESGDAGLGGGIALVIRSRIGELPDSEVEWLTASDLTALLLYSTDEGRSADAERYIAIAVRKAGQPTEKNASNYRSLAARLAACGQIAAARKLAAAIPSTSSDRAMAFAVIAIEERSIGDAAGAAQDVREAVASTGALHGSDRMITHGSIMSEVIAAGDSTSIGELADALRDDEAGDTTAVRRGVYFLTAVANAYATIGRRADFDRVVTAAEKAVPLQRRENQPSGWIEVATAYARAGEKAKAQAAAAQSLASGRIPPSHQLELELYALAYAKAGDFDAAVESLRIVLPDRHDRSKPLGRIAGLQAASGHYAEAERTAAEIDDPFMKLKVHRQIVIERVKKQQLDGLADWIASHATTRERAILYLAVAQKDARSGGKRRDAHF